MGTCVSFVNLIGNLDVCMVGSCRLITADYINTNLVIF